MNTMRQPAVRVGQWTTLGLVVAVFSGCASVPEGLGRSEVDGLVAGRGQSVGQAAEALLPALTSAPLSAQSAVRIALINNPQLQASYARLGFGAADLYEAGRIRNPIFSGAFLGSDVAGERDQVTFGLVATFTDLITLRSRKRLAEGAFAALQEAIGAEVLAVAAEAEKAYYSYVGAQQVAALRDQIASASAVSADLAQRFRDAGNLTPRELAMERAAASKAQLSALEARGAAYAARKELATVMGLSVGGDWQVPAALRPPLAVEDELETLLTLAEEARLDLAAARTRADVVADRLGVVEWTRWLGDLDVGLERERETDGAHLTGPTVDWEVPILNQHKDVVLRANAELQIALTDVRRIANDVDNGVRLAYAKLQNARSRIDEYRDVLIPQQIETVARAQEEVNFMLIGIFELIALKQDEYDAYQGYLGAIRDYWIARADLALATGTTLPSSTRIGDERIDVDEFLRPRAPATDHSTHGDQHEPPHVDEEADADSDHHQENHGGAQ